MPLIAVETPVGTGGVVGTSFPLQGNQYEFLPFDALVEFAVIIKNKAAITAVQAVAKVQVYSGSDLLSQDQQLDVLEPTQSLEYPEHYQLQDVAGAGERLSVQLQIEGLSDIADSVVQTRVRITPV